MPNYILAYHGGNKPDSPEEGAEHRAKWENWANNLGESLINRGNPLGQSKTVDSGSVTDGGGTDPLIGYSILQAETLDAAVKMVEDSPHINFGGTMVVAEIIEM